MQRNEIRCGNCNRLLACGQALDLVIKCPKCKTLNHLRAPSTSPETQEARKEPNLDTER